MLKCGAVSILLLFTCVARPDLETSPFPPPLGRLVDAGGYRAHGYCTGTGSPTVVIVGGGFLSIGVGTAVARQVDASLHLRSVRHSPE